MGVPLSMFECDLAVGCTNQFSVQCERDLALLMSMVGDWIGQIGCG